MRDLDGMKRRVDTLERNTFSNGTTASEYEYKMKMKAEMMAATYMPKSTYLDDLTLKISDLAKIHKK